MSPILRSAVKFTQRIRNPEMRKLTLSLIETATKDPELAPFTVACLGSASALPSWSLLLVLTDYL